MIFLKRPHEWISSNGPITACPFADVHWRMRAQVTLQHSGRGWFFFKFFTRTHNFAAPNISIHLPLSYHPIPSQWAVSNRCKGQFSTWAKNLNKMCTPPWNSLLASHSLLTFLPAWFSWMQNKVAWRVQSCSKCLSSSEMAGQFPNWLKAGQQGIMHNKKRTNRRKLFIYCLCIPPLFYGAECSKDRGPWWPVIQELHNSFPLRTTSGRLGPSSRPAAFCWSDMNFSVLNSYSQMQTVWIARNSNF